MLGSDSEVHVLHTVCESLHQVSEQCKYAHTSYVCLSNPTAPWRLLDSCQLQIILKCDALLCSDLRFVPMQSEVSVCHFDAVPCVHSLFLMRSPLFRCHLSSPPLQQLPLFLLTCTVWWPGAGSCWCLYNNDDNHWRETRLDLCLCKNVCLHQEFNEFSSSPLVAIRFFLVIITFYTV